MQISDEEIETVARSPAPTEKPTTADSTEPSTEALAASLELLRSAATEPFHRQMARTLDAFAAAATATERERSDREIAWLRRLLHWCRSRLNHASYQTWLDKYLALGPSDAPGDEPLVIRSSANSYNIKKDGSCRIASDGFCITHQTANWSECANAKMWESMKGDKP